MKIIILILCGIAFTGFGKAQDSAGQEWKRSNPDVVAYLPTGKTDGDNEMFLVFEAPKSDELLAVWTQSTVENNGDNRAAFARSKDGVNWSDPMILKGIGPGRKDNREASWVFPIVTKTGRIYCFYVKEMEMHVAKDRQMGGPIGTLYSDDNGQTWIDGADISVPKITNFDHPDADYPPTWFVHQKPIRDSKGRWIVGYSRTANANVIPKPGPNWVDIETRAAFMRFENLDDGPDPKDLKVTWLPKNDPDGLEVPHKNYPQTSFCQEPALALLPDGRLFTVMRTMTGHIWYSVSEDDGDTWRKPEPLRYKDGGKTVDHPVSPCPIYRLQDGRYLLFFHNNNGTKGKYSQFIKEKWTLNQVSHLRNPVFTAVGEFRKDARQPIWFSEPKQFLDNGGVVLGPKKTASIGLYPSLTEHQGKRTYWHSDSKHFLLGHYIPDEMLEDMRVPRPLGPQ